MLEAAAGVLILAGAFFMLVSALGVLRLPDLFMRMHAATKAGTLGAGLVLFAAALLSGELAVSIKAVVVFLFLLLTAPVAAHVLGRAAYYAGIELWDRTMTDELKGKYDQATEERDGPGGSPSAGASPSPAPTRR
jgi:multicomponent Na+:H+ antiporter subunit G